VGLPSSGARRGLFPNYLLLEVSEENAGARAVAMTVDLCKNGSTTTATMNLEPLEPPTSASAADKPAPTRHSAQRAGNEQEKKILYGLNDCPSWYLCIFLGFQVRRIRPINSRV